MKLIFIYNPNSGNGRILKKIDFIEKEFKKNYDEVVIRETQSRQDLFACVKEACNIYDVIAFAGGDGTFNDVANVVCREEKRPILAYIPAGTINDIARNLRIPRNIKKAVRIICKGEVSYHDAGLINDEYFVYAAGIGTFTKVGYETKQNAKKYLGKLAYIFDGLGDLMIPKLVNVKINCLDTNEEITGEYPLVLVLNSKTCGGYPVNRGGHLNDGYFDIICVKKLIKLHSLNIINLFFLGTNRKKLITNYYKMTRSKDFTIQVSDDISWALDGEKGMSGNVHIRNLHKHLQIIVPMKRSKPLTKHLLPNNTIEVKK